MIILPKKGKIQLTGSSTFIVSLPIKWVREIGLSAGDSVTLTPRPDRTLFISPEPMIDDRVLYCNDQTLARR